MTSVGLSYHIIDINASLHTGGSYSYELYTQALMVQLTCNDSKCLSSPNRPHHNSRMPIPSKRPVVSSSPKLIYIVNNHIHSYTHIVNR